MPPGADTPAPGQSARPVATSSLADRRGTAARLSRRAPRSGAKPPPAPAGAEPPFFTLGGQKGDPGSFIGISFSFSPFCPPRPHRLAAALRFPSFFFFRPSFRVPSGPHQRPARPPLQRRPRGALAPPFFQFAAAPRPRHRGPGATRPAAPAQKGAAATPTRTRAQGNAPGPAARAGFVRVSARARRHDDQTEGGGQHRKGVGRKASRRAQNLIICRAVLGRLHGGDRCQGRGPKGPAPILDTRTLFRQGGVQKAVI